MLEIGQFVTGGGEEGQVGEGADDGLVEQIEVKFSPSWANFQVRDPGPAGEGFGGNLLDAGAQFPGA